MLAVLRLSLHRFLLATLLLAGCGLTGTEMAHYLITLQVGHFSPTTGLASTCEVLVRFEGADPLPVHLQTSGIADVRRLLTGNGTTASSQDTYEPVSIELLHAGSSRTITLSGPFQDTVVVSPSSGPWRCRSTLPPPNAALVAAGYDLPPDEVGTAKLELVP